MRPVLADRETQKVSCGHLYLLLLGLISAGIWGLLLRSLPA